MAGRAAVLAWEETRGANPCVHHEHAGTFEYGDVTYQLTGDPGGSTFDACSKLIHLVLRLDADCGAPQVII